jgi:VCBS repeat-containing protein
MATKNIGFVADLVGAAQIRGVDAVVRVLSIGDPIYDGDVLSTGPGANILLEFFNGNQLKLDENVELLLDVTVSNGLDAFPDDLVDSLTQLRGLAAEEIEEVVDEAGEEGLDANASSRDYAQDVQPTAIYSREASEGVVDTPGGPLDFSGSVFTTQDSSELVGFSESETGEVPSLPSSPPPSLPSSPPPSYGSVDVDVVANDTDVDGTIDPTTVVITSGPSNGTVSVNGTTGVVTYTPNADYFGADSFSYTVADDVGNTSDPAAVNLTITNVNDAPVAVVDTGATDQDAILSVPAGTGVLSNDTDLDGDTLIVSAVNGVAASVGNPITLASGASLTLNADGSYDYDPNGAFAGLAVGATNTDSFDYTVSDGNGDSDFATVTITLTGTNNNAPVATDDTDATDQNTPILGSSVLTNDIAAVFGEVVAAGHGQRRRIVRARDRDRRRGKITAAVTVDDSIREAISVGDAVGETIEGAVRVVVIATIRPQS